MELDVWSFKKVSWWRERERESDEGEWLLLYPGDDDKVAWSQGDAL
jgi:hypothetical protein